MIEQKEEITTNVNIVSTLLEKENVKKELNNCEKNSSTAEHMTKCVRVSHSITSDSVDHSLFLA